jgi:hypothetical protein
MSGEPDPAAWLEEALAVLVLRLRHEVALTRALRGDGRQEGFLGLLMSDDEAERMLDEMSGRIGVEGGLATARTVADLHRSLTERRRQNPEGIWSRLASAFHLSDTELDVLVLAAAPALDPRFGRVYGYLNDDMARRHLTPALVRRLLGRDLDALTLRRVLADEAELIGAGLIHADAGTPTIERALRIDEHLLDLLLGAEVHPPGTVLRLGTAAVPARPLLIAGGSPAEASVEVLQQGKERGWSLSLLPDPIGPEALRRSVLDARLTGTVCVLRTLTPDLAPRSAVPILRRGSVVLTDDPGAWLAAGLDAEVVPPGPVSESLRREWVSALGGALVARRPDSDMGQLLVNARHLDLFVLAESAARGDLDGVEHAVESRATSSLKSFAHPIRTRKQLSDLVLPDASIAALRRLLSWSAAGAQVLEGWGLGEVFDKRAGVVAMFKGPSGTGKTMAAGIVAGELGLPAFRIDLAAMVSKYIGETEKHLEQVFTAAEQTDALLFFDEADAIFGDRSPVKDARDRYANMETSYLLQRLDGFDGVAVLATNLAQNIDPAFLRRIDMVVEFPAPDAPRRRALWERGTIGSAPVAPNLDLDLVAARFELTGGEIRNCWLDAAHRAVVRGVPVGMAEVMDAVAAELTKQGKPLRKTDFGEHYPRAERSWP